MPANYEPYDDRQLQTPVQRLRAVKELYKRVFFDSADFALNNPEDQLDERTPLDYALDSIENFRKIEEIITSYPTSEIAPPEMA